FTSKDLAEIRAVVYYYDNTGSFENADGELSASTLTILSDYVKTGGNIFLGGFATRIIDDLGRIPYEPGIAGHGAGGDNPDNWGLNNSIGLPEDQSGHPVFNNLSLTNEVFP